MSVRRSPKSYTLDLFKRDTIFFRSLGEPALKQLMHCHHHQLDAVINMLYFYGDKIGRYPVKNCQIALE